MLGNFLFSKQSKAGDCVPGSLFLSAMAVVKLLSPRHWPSLRRSLGFCFHWRELLSALIRIHAGLSKQPAAPAFQCRKRVSVQQVCDRCFCRAEKAASERAAPSEQHSMARAKKEHQPSHVPRAALETRPSVEEQHQRQVGEVNPGDVLEHRGQAKE